MKQLNEITIEQLLADIDITNNGYIYQPTQVQYDCASKHPDLVNRSGHQLKRVSTKIERYPIKRKSIDTSYLSNHDFEGAILARQEKYEV